MFAEAFQHFWWSFVGNRDREIRILGGTA